MVTDNFNESVNDVNNQYHEELLKNQDLDGRVENTSEETETSLYLESLETQDLEQESSADLKNLVLILMNQTYST